MTRSDSSIHTYTTCTVQGGAVYCTAKRATGLGVTCLSLSLSLLRTVPRLDWLDLWGPLPYITPISAKRNRDPHGYPPRSVSVSLTQRCDADSMRHFFADAPAFVGNRHLWETSPSFPVSPFDVSRPSVSALGQLYFRFVVRFVCLLPGNRIAPGLAVHHDHIPQSSLCQLSKP